MIMIQNTTIYIFLGELELYLSIIHVKLILLAWIGIISIELEPKLK